MTKRDVVDRIKANLTGVYKRFKDIERDRRLSHADKLELLRVWPAKDDFERGRLAARIQEMEENQ